MEFGSFSFSCFFFKVFFLKLSCTREGGYLYLEAMHFWCLLFKFFFWELEVVPRVRSARSLVWLGSTSHRVEAFLLACSFWEGFYNRLS